MEPSVQSFITQCNYLGEFIDHDLASLVSLAKDVCEKGICCHEVIFGVATVTRGDANGEDVELRHKLDVESQQWRGLFCELVLALLREKGLEGVQV
jgi:hypothetical protein